MMKQEAIANAYGEYWEQVKYHVDENGWCTMIGPEYNQLTPTFTDLELARDYVDANLDSGYNPEKQTFEWRPKSLRGIETNNGWIKLEIIKDIPKEGIYWVVDRKKRVRLANILIGFAGPHSILELYTHYQEPTEPAPPIY